MRSLVTALFLGAALATPLADVWDVQTENDNTAATDNELLHGTAQIHDLGSLFGPSADQDWYLMPQPPRTSWEVLVDGTSGDFGPSGPTLERIAGDGMTVQQSSVPAVPGGAGYSRALRWQNATTSPSSRRSSASPALRAAPAAAPTTSMRSAPANPRSPSRASTIPARR